MGTRGAEPKWMGCGMGKFFRRTGLWILLAAVSLALVGALIALVQGGETGLLSDLAGRLTRPVEGVLHSLEEKAEDFYNRSFAYERLQAEYEALQDQVNDLEKKALTGLAATQENQRLRNLLILADRRQEWTLEPAMVLASSWDSWSAWIKLDKGTDDGLSIGDCVVDDGGALVGRVAETGGDWSTVRLITDPALSLSVQDLRTGERLVSGGDFSLLPQGKLGLSCLPEDCRIGARDEIVTLATRGSYPSGILVGRVEALEEDASGLWEYGVVRPAADLTHLTQVFCIKDFVQED